MNKYRIRKKITERGRTIYIPEKRFLGFLWWCTYGYRNIYATELEAELVIECERNKQKAKSEIVKYYER